MIDFFSSVAFAMSDGAISAPVDLWARFLDNALTVVVLGLGIWYFVKKEARNEQLISGVISSNTEMIKKNTEATASLERAVNSLVAEHKKGA